MASGSSLDQNLTLEVQKNLYGNAYLNMLWHCPADPRFHYWAHLRDEYFEEKDPSYRLMVIIHGTGCATESFIAEAKAIADANSMAILAPVFPGGLLDRDDFNSYKLLSDHGVRYDQVLLAMVEDMMTRYPGVRGETFFLFGHSGGGQFTNRFLLAHPERLQAVSIGAPGRPTYLNFQEDYFWGVRDFRDYFDKDVDLEAIRKVPVQITVGEYDTKFIGDSPYGSCRVERMRSLQKNFRDNGIDASLEILPGLEHGDGFGTRVQAAQRFFLKHL